LILFPVLTSYSCASLDAMTANCSSLLNVTAVMGSLYNLPKVCRCMLNCRSCNMAVPSRDPVSTVFRPIATDETRS